MTFRITPIKDGPFPGHHSHCFCPKSSFFAVLHQPKKKAILADGWGQEEVCPVTVHIDPLPIRVLHLPARWGRLRGLDWRPAACLFDRGKYLPRPFLPSFSLVPTFPFSPRSLRSCLGFLGYGFFDPRRRCRSRCVTRAVEVRTLSSSGGSNLLVFFLTQCLMRSFSSSGCLRSSYRPFTAQGEARGGDGLGELSPREAPSAAAD